MEKNKITVRTIVSANANEVWDHWTMPEHIINWNFASDDWHCPEAANDLKTGGKFNYRMASKDGKTGFDFEGVYDDVVEKQKIAYSMADGRQVIIEFEQVGDKTIVKETFDPESVNSLDLQRNGWQSILDNFKKYVESD